MVPIDLMFAEEKDGGYELQVLKPGKWDHPSYGMVEITDEIQQEFVANFNKDLRAHSSTIGLPIDEEHYSDKGATGWIKQLINKGNEGLFAIVEWNSKGRQLIKDAVYRFFSPEFYFQYEDPEDRRLYNNVLIGGALTNRPYFKGLNPVVLSESIIHKDMKLSEILKKKLADLSDAEKSFVTSHFNELSDEEKTQMVDLKPQETEEEKKAREEAEAKAKAEAEEKAKADEEAKKKAEEEAKAKEGQFKEGDACKMPDGKDGKMGMKDGKMQCMSEADYTASIKASEKSVTMSEKEVKQLREDAEAGRKAKAELAKKAMSEKVDGLIYSEKNEAGKLPATVKDKVTEFAMSLSEDQQAKFFEIVGSLPTVKMFAELGESAFSEPGKAPKGVSEESFALDNKAKELMKANDKLTYEAALTMAEKELAKK